MNYLGTSKGNGETRIVALTHQLLANMNLVNVLSTQNYSKSWKFKYVYAMGSSQGNVNMVLGMISITLTVNLKAILVFVASNLIFYFSSSISSRSLYAIPLLFFKRRFNYLVSIFHSKQNISLPISLQISHYSTHSPCAPQWALYLTASNTHLTGTSS